MSQERNDRELIAKLVRCALFTALIIIGSKLPDLQTIGLPVPFVLANLFVILAGLLLGPWWALASVALFLFLGLLGLPVFAANVSGLAVFSRPSGGYLVGYLVAAVVAGVVAGAPRKSFSTLQFLRCAAACFLGFLSIYVVGVPWLSALTGMDIVTAISKGCVPFIIGDLLKLVVALAIALPLRRIVARQ